MAWNDLTLSDKARMINLAVKSGITDLKTIHEVYNKFEDGGNLILKPVEDKEIYPDSATVENKRYSSDRENIMYDYLRDRGLNHIQASSLLGNFAVESYLDANMKQKRGPAYGLMQAEGPRKKAMRNYHEVPYVFGSSLTPEEQQQLDYIINKGMLTYTPGEWGGKGFKGARAARSAYLNESDIEKASDIVTKNYLRPSKPNLDRRRQMSKYIDKSQRDRYKFRTTDIDFFLK